MFGNTQQDDQANNNTNMDQVAQDINDPSQASAPASPTFGLGVNPSSFTPTQNPDPLPTPQTPTEEEQAPALHHEEVISPQTHEETPAAAPSGALEEIKSQALQQLSPLVSQLDQSPEEKYKTLMMMIQASDNHDLIKDAYAAANAIEDEKVRAEALLSIVNEINYFTQQTHNN